MDIPKRIMMVMACFAAASLNTGCAAFLHGPAPTPYQPYQSTLWHSKPDMDGRIDGGYTDYHIKGDRYSITFKGNGVTDRSLVTKYAHQRAMELCLQEKYRDYKVLNETQSSEWHQKGSVEMPHATLDVQCTR